MDDSLFDIFNFESLNLEDENVSVTVVSFWSLWLIFSSDSNDSIFFFSFSISFPFSSILRDFLSSLVIFSFFSSFPFCDFSCFSSSYTAELIIMLSVCSLPSFLFCLFVYLFVCLCICVCYIKDLKNNLLYINIKNFHKKKKFIYEN